MTGPFKEVPLISSDQHRAKKLTGLSSDYYKLTLADGHAIEALDIIEALNLNFAEGNILKALWRIAAARRGEGKAGVPMIYDAEKIVFFAERILVELRRVADAG